MKLRDTYVAWETILRRFDAWYRGTVADRPPVTIMNVWRPMSAPLPTKTYASHRERVLDAEFRVAHFEAALHCQAYVGDTFPLFGSNIASDQLAPLFGGELEYGAASVWANHNLANIRDVLARKPDLTCECWSAIRRMMDLSIAQSEGRWLTALPACLPDADLLVALRGPDNLCMDLADDPEGVRLAMEHVDQFMPQLYDDLWQRLQVAEMPTAWEGELTAGRAARLGSDFLCMISPAMARHAFYPILQRQAARLDRCYFHVDSEGWLNHLDWLLELPEVNGIQWVYGANRGPASKWVPVFQRIQAAGKSIELLPTSAADALETIRHLKPEGVWIKFFGGFSEEDARRFVDEVAKRSNWA